MRGRVPPAIAASLLVFGVVWVLFRSAGAGEPPASGGDPEGAPPVIVSGEPDDVSGEPAEGRVEHPAHEGPEALEHDHSAHGPPPPKAAETAAGPALEVAREFAETWVNRPREPAKVHRQGERLVSLASGLWALEIRDTFAVALRGGERQGGGEGSVVVVETVRRSAEGVAVLVVTRERLLPLDGPPAPYRYATYVARLVAVEGGFAVASWEPQL